MSHSEDFHFKESQYEGRKAEEAECINPNAAVDNEFCPCPRHINSKASWESPTLEDDNSADPDEFSHSDRAYESQLERDHGYN